jgi:hypothetical protein
MLSPRPKRVKPPENREDSAKCPAFLQDFLRAYTVASGVFFLKKG